MAQIQINDLERPVQELKFKEMKGIFGGFVTSYPTQTLTPNTLVGAPVESTLSSAMLKMDLDSTLLKL